MAPPPWADLPTDILSLIVKILNTDVDRLRLRSVCSQWRSFVHRCPRPSPFPLKLPPIIHGDISSDCGPLYLNYTTLYHLSPPKHGPRHGDPSDGWLIRVSEVNTNRFSLFAPLLPDGAKFPVGTFPMALNLLECRIDEVCRCYDLRFHNSDRKLTNLWPTVKTVLPLWNYTAGCEFVVLALLIDRSLWYWKFGDKEWTSIEDTKGFLVNDVILYKGQLHAITRQRVLVSFDSNFSLSMAYSPRLHAHYENDLRLVQYRSDLYVLAKIWQHPSVIQSDLDEIPLRLRILKKRSLSWEIVRCLGDVFFISAEDFSVGLSPEDFCSIEGNCVYMAHMDILYALHYGNVLFGAYDLDSGRTTRLLETRPYHTVLYQPSPGWLLPSC